MQRPVISRRISRRTIAHAVLAALAASLLTFLTATPAHATHFRFRDLTWRYDHVAADGRNVVELTMRVADRRSYYGALQVGSPFIEWVDTGDGSSIALNGEVIAVNAVDDWFIAEVRGFHTYTGGGPFTVSWTSCCTLSTLRNSPDSSLRTTTVINLGDGNRHSPVSLVSPIVHLPAGGLHSFRIPATDPDGDNVSFRLASVDESLVTQPTGMQIDERTGVVTWDTTGRSNGLWMATVVMTDTAGASTMNTFLINLGGTSSAPPTWVEEGTFATPPDRANFSVKPGDTFPLVIAAEDPDGQPVTITPLNSPPGFDCVHQQIDGQAVTSCAWRPEATGTYLVAFDAQDPTGASAGLRVFRLTAPRYVAFGDSYSSGEGARNADNYEVGTNEGGDGNECRRASTAYPSLVTTDEEVPWTLDFVACSGARTWHFNDAQYSGAGKQQLPQFDMADLGQDVELVTLTIGGNDSKFSEIVKECILGFELLPFNDCHSDPGKTEHEVQDAFARLRGEDTTYGKGEVKTVPLAEIYSEILRQAPRARVIVLGYPQFFRDGGTFINRCSGVHKSDQQWVNEKVEEINDLLREEAESLGLEFVYTSDAFDGHRLCEIGGGEDREWFRDIVVSDQNASFHPDDDGHFAMYQLLLDKIANPPAGFTMTDEEVHEILVDVTTLQEWLDLFARWPGSDVEMTVTSPSGKVYSRGSIGDAKHLLGPTYESFRIPNPEPGTWRVRLYGADLGANGELVQFTSNVRGSWNHPPEAEFTMDLDGNTLHLDGSASTDPDGDDLTGYHWFIRNANQTVVELDGRTAQHTFAGPGNYTVTLRVVDEHGKAGFRGTGQPVTVGHRYTVDGPHEPLDPAVEWTAVQAGRTLPVTWRLTESGVPVTVPASFVGLTSLRIDCDSGAYAADLVAGDTSGVSGLAYHSDGNWQYNWQTRKDWSGTCRVATVNFDDGSTMSAKLRFR